MIYDIYHDFIYSQWLWKRWTHKFWLWYLQMVLFYIINHTYESHPTSRTPFANIRDPRPLLLWRTMQEIPYIELPVSASQEDIRDAFRRLSKKYHPDRNPGSRERFEKINVGIVILTQLMRLFTMRIKSICMTVWVLKKWTILMSITSLISTNSKVQNWK